MNRILLIVILIMYIGVSCKNTNTIDEERNNKKVNNKELEAPETSVFLKEKIYIIEKEVVNLSVIIALFYSDSFMEVFENSSKYLDEAISLLADTTLTEQQIYILFYSMQRLGIDEYLKFLNQCTILYKEKIIDEKFTELAIFPYFGGYCVIGLNYKNEEVRKILKDIIEYDHNSRYFKRFIRRTLRGKTLRQFKRGLKQLDVTLYEGLAC